MNKSTGGPAFPRPAGWNGLNGVEEHSSNEPQDGMTVRDYFAAQAMQVEISTACHSIKNAQALVGAAEDARRTIEQQIAHNAYSMAEAMIAERQRRENC